MNLELIVPFLYPAALAAALAALRWPEIGVYYLAFIFPLQTLRYELHEYPFGASILDVVLLGVILGIFLHRHTPLFTEFPVRRVLLVFLLYLYISLWNGSALLGGQWPVSFQDPRLSNWKSVAELCLLCFFVFAAIKTERQIKIMLVVLMVSVLLVSYDFYQVMQAQDLTHYSYTLRNPGVLGYAGANGLAAFEVQMALFLLGFRYREMPNPLRWLLPLALLGAFYSVLFGFSRGAYVAFAAGILFLGWVRKQLLMTLAILALAVAVLLPGAVGDRIKGTYTQGQSSTEAELDNSAQERMMIWEDAIQVARSYPIRGTGFDTYRLLHRSSRFGDTHNFYLKVLLEEGLVGLTIFLLLLWQMYRCGMELYRESEDQLHSALGRGFATCMVGLAVVNIFGDRWTYQQVNSYIWILLALVCRARLLSTQTKEALGGDPEAAPLARLQPA